jgi:hypothetical protein
MSGVGASANDSRVGVTAGCTGNATLIQVNVNFPFSAQRMSWRLQGQ